MNTLLSIWPWGHLWTTPKNMIIWWYPLRLSPVQWHFHTELVSQCNEFKIILNVHYYWTSKSEDTNSFILQQCVTLPATHCPLPQQQQQLLHQLQQVDALSSSCASSSMGQTGPPWSPITATATNGTLQPNHRAYDENNLVKIELTFA